MFTLMRLILELITIGTCYVKHDGEWSCTEFCLGTVKAGCDSHIMDLSTSSISALLKYESKFVDFTSAYYRNYFIPEQKQRLVSNFLELIYQISLDLKSHPDVPLSDTKWLRSRLLMSYMKFKTNSQQEIIFEMMPEFKGLHETLKGTLNDLNINITQEQGSSTVPDVIDWPSA